MGFLKIIGVIFLVLGGLCLITGVYFYNFHTFKTFRVCISDSPIQDTSVSCKSNLECKDLLAENIPEFKDIESAPDFMRSKAREVTDNAIYCEGTCKIKYIYSNLEGYEGEGLRCLAGDYEVTINLRGKELLELAKFMSNAGN